MSQPRSILILSTEAGSGHRSAAYALQSAFTARYGPAAQVSICNPWHHRTAPQLLRSYERAYLNQLQQRPGLHELGYALSELPGVAHALDAGMRRWLAPTMGRILAEYQPDLVISVYPRFAAAVAASCRAGMARPRLLTIVTDLGAIHHCWFTRQSDYSVVPTAIAWRKALQCGIDPRRLRTIGIPIDPAFGHPRASVAALRRDLGWEPETPTLLLLGGGAGVGQIARLATALDAARLPLQLAVVAGANQPLAAQLRARSWRIPVHVYGFAPLADLMHAADMVATKAGGLTISEALAAGKPLLIHSAPVGQEAGNLHYLQALGAACWVPEPAALVAQVGRWLACPSERQILVAAARRIGCPAAADQIARLGWHIASAASPLKHPRTIA